MGFAVSAHHWVKLKEIPLPFKGIFLKSVGHNSDVVTTCNWYSWYSHQSIFKGTGGLGNKRKSRYHPNNYFIIEKCPGDLKGLTVTQTSVKNHQLILT